MFILGTFVVQSQENISVISQIGGTEQFAEAFQEGTLNNILIEQQSDGPQSAWVFQSGEMVDEITGAISVGGEANHATVDQKYLGTGNQSFLYQFGSYNQSTQTQNGSNNKFNIEGGDFLTNLLPGEGPSGAVPNQDGDYHKLTQTAIGDNNQAWMYQAGRYQTGSQYIQGDYNQVWTSQSGLSNTSTMNVIGKGNGSIYLVHEEGKFPESDEVSDEGSSGHSGGQGNGNSANSGGSSDEGGMPEVIPPIHDEDHVFVPTVSVAIKQMGNNSNAVMNINGDYNKAVISQRGGAGEGGHFAEMNIIGSYNRIFADQRGKEHTINQYVNGDENLVVFMQKGNGSKSDLTLYGNSNEIGVDQKGKGSVSNVYVEGNYNGNFDLLADEFGIKVVQEGKQNQSGIGILGDNNFINVHQGGGAISTVNQTGSWNIATVNQATIDE